MLMMAATMLLKITRGLMVLLLYSRMSHFYSRLKMSNRRVLMIGIYIKLG